MKRTLLATVSIAGMVIAGAAYAGPVTLKDLLNDATSTNQVVTNGMGYQAHRYSPLDQINTTNVKNLVPAWSFSFGGEKQRGQEATALVHNGVIYISASYSRVFAIDAKTGDKLWEWDARLPEGILPCCDVINRGVALFGDKVYVGTLDSKIYALDAKTGRVVWRKTVGDFKAGYSYSGAPMIVPSKNGPLLITGDSGGEFGIVGMVQARNPETGDLVWQRPVLEGLMGEFKGKPSTMTGKLHQTWKGDMYKHGGGATWLGGTYDPETKLIYFGTGNPAPWNSWLRPGDNRWTASRIAIDPDNGQIKWGFQTTPHDGWDYDGVNEFIPFDHDGQKLGGTADRNGFFYVLNRETGKYLRSMPFVSKISWAKGIDKNGRPEFNNDFRPGDPTKAPSGKAGKSVFAVPSFLGAKNQMPVSYSDQTHLFYVPSNEWGMDIHNEPVVYKKGAAYLGAGFNVKPIFKDHIGSLKAIDPIAMKVVWEWKNKAPLWGGVLSTAGGLVFTGTPEGYLMAFNAKTGDVLWKFNVGTGIVAPPIAWEQDGQEVIGVAAGWGGAVPLWGGEVAKTFKGIDQGGSYWLFKLFSATASK